jgi:hypothetical protein
MNSTRDTMPPPYGWAAVTAAVVLALYVVTLGPTIAFWDTAEYIAAAKVLGIPHPPGNPLFVVVGHVFGLLPLFAEYAARINFFAAVTSAVAAGLWFLIADRWLRSIVTWRPARLAAAFAGVFVSATMWTVWNQSTVNEKVYTVSVLSMALVMWIVVHWGDDEPGPHRDRWLILMAYVVTLSSTNHMMGVLAAPAVLIYVLWTDWREAFRPWVLLLGWLTLIAVSGVWAETVGGTSTGIAVGAITVALLGYALWRDSKNPMLYLGILAVVVGISLNYLFLPIRAAHYPAINEGEPTSWQALLEVLNRAQYGKPPVSERQADLLSQLGNYWQYWTWQFARDTGAISRVATAFFTSVGLVGLWTLIRRETRAGIAALAMLGTLTLALIFYLNFKYGFSQHPDQPDLPREVRERDYFFICSFAYFGTLIAVGFGAIMQAIVEAMQGRGTERSRWLAASPLLGLALVPLFGNRYTAPRSHETTPRDWAVDLLQSVEPYSILITAGDNDTFPLWFAQEVEGVRRDVLLANLSLLNTEWHLKQVRRRKLDTFDPARAASVWRQPTPPRQPDNPVFRLSEAELVGLPELSQTPPSGAVAVDSVQIRIGGQYISRSDVAVILLIQDNLGKRPIYFSWSTGGFPDQTLGLTPYLVSEGLARRLNPAPVMPGGNIILSQGMGFVDIARSRALMWDEYRWQGVARARPRGWVDVPSESIVQLYGIIYAGMGESLRQVGDSSGAARADSVATAITRALRPTAR